MSQISPTFNASGGGKTYRPANNLTIDYDSVDELKSIWQDQIAVNKEVMQIVATSQETMELHAKTPFVMDAVAGSTTATDAIGTSGVGYDEVAAVPMAIGKFVAGIAGLDPTTFSDINAVTADASAMDAVAGSTTAMNAVVGSTTAMNAVVGSTTAMNAVVGSATGLRLFLLSSNVNSLFWSDETGTEAFWNHKGDLAESYWNLDGDSRHGGQALFLDCDQFPSGGDRISWTIDMTNVNNITVFEKTFDARGANFEIVVGGTTEYSASANNTSYQGRTVDVSNRDGSQSLSIGLAGADAPGSETLVSDIQLN